MMSAARITGRPTPRPRPRRKGPVKATVPESELCDRCRDRRNTLFDLPEGLLCLVCAFNCYDETKLSHINLLIRAAVSGRINIERRRRAIAKRNGTQSRRRAA